MAGLQCRDDSLQLAEALESLQCIIISDSIVLSTTYITQETVLRTNARVVQAVGQTERSTARERGTKSESVETMGGSS